MEEEPMCRLSGTFGNRPYQSVICPSKAWYVYNLGNYFFSEICAILPPTRRFGYKKRNLFGVKAGM